MDTTLELGSNSVSKLIFLSSAANDPEVWEAITGHLNEHGKLFTDNYSPEKARWLVENKHMDLWTGGAAVDGKLYLEIYAFTSIKTFERRKVFHIWFVGGKNILHYINALDVFRKYAEENNCTHVECNARPGIERLLRKLGLKPVSSNFSMSLRTLKELN